MRYIYYISVLILMFSINVLAQGVPPQEWVCDYTMVGELKGQYGSLPQGTIGTLSARVVIDPNDFTQSANTLRRYNLKSHRSPVKLVVEGNVIAVAEAEIYQTVNSDGMDAVGIQTKNASGLVGGYLQSGSSLTSSFEMRHWDNQGGIPLTNLDAPNDSAAFNAMKDKYFDLIHVPGELRRFDVKNVSHNCLRVDRHQLLEPANTFSSRLSTSQLSLTTSFVPLEMLGKWSVALSPRSYFYTVDGKYFVETRDIPFSVSTDGSNLTFNGRQFSRTGGLLAQDVVGVWLDATNDEEMNFRSDGSYSIHYSSTQEIYIGSYTESGTSIALKELRALFSVINNEITFDPPYEPIYEATYSINSTMDEMTVTFTDGRVIVYEK